jgi:hypothetical protein
MLGEIQTVRQEEATAASKDITIDEVDSIAERIRLGAAVLRVVAYPWGVEFDVCDPISVKDK